MKPGKAGGEKTLVVMVTARGFRMLFQKMWAGDSCSPVWEEALPPGEKSFSPRPSIGTTLSRL